MDEVDNIIILSLKTIGCKLDESVHGLQSFDSDLIYQAVLLCVEAIQMSPCDFPRSLPPGMSQRFKVGSALAAAVTELGYRGEIGYQTFLYSNENDIRKILVYLIEKLPKESSGEPAQSTDSSSVLRSLICTAINDQIKRLWLPHVCQQRQQRQQFRGHDLLAPRVFNDPKLAVSAEVRSYQSTYLPYLNKQAISCPNLCSALLENNSRLIVADQSMDRMLQSRKEKINKTERKAEIRSKLKQERQIINKLDKDDQLQAEIGSKAGLRFQQLERLQFSDDKKDDSATSDQSGASKDTATSEEEILEQQKQEMDSLRADLQQATARIEKIQRNMERLKTAEDQTKREMDEAMKKVEDTKALFQVKKKTLDVLPESEQTIVKLENLIATADERMRGLERTWQEHKAPLMDQVEHLKQLGTLRQQEIEGKLAEVQDFKQSMKALQDESKTKDELLKQLTAEYETMPKELSRSSYTKRILEIVANIKKQKHDIDKVLVDTRSVQKEINILTGKLERTFTVTDELIFKDAKKDDTGRASYKYLASLHENCHAVITTIEETGFIMREIRELEDQIDQEREKRNDANLDKILQDYQQMKKENQTLLTKLKHDS